MSNSLAAPGGDQRDRVKSSDTYIAEHENDLSRASSMVTRTCVALAVLAGIGLHVFLLGRSTVDADEAVVGLMANAITHGHFSAFYWGQPYGGSEAYVTAALFLIFGSSAFVLKLTATLLASCCAILTWRLGRRLIGPRAGIAAGLIFFLWPEVNVYAATKEYGFRWAALTCGLVVLLLTAKILGGDRRSLTWLGLGVAVGIGWWSTPEIIYEVAPAALVLGYSILRRHIKLTSTQATLCVGGFLIGALPWLWANFHDGFASFGLHKTAPYDHLLRIFVVDALPLALGLRLRSSSSWVVPNTLALVFYALFTLVLVGEAVRLGWLRRAPLLVVSFVAFPFLYSLFPVGFWTDGRFTLAYGPTLAILLAAAATEGVPALVTFLRAQRRVSQGVTERHWRVVIPAVLIVIGIALTAAAIPHEDPERASPITLVDRGAWTWHANPNNLVDTAIKLLERHSVHDVYAGYWLAYPISYLARGSVIATDASPPIRDLTAYDIVLNSVRPSWMFVTATGFVAVENELRQGVLNPGCSRVPSHTVCLSPQLFEKRLRSAGITYHEWTDTLFIVIQPSRNVTPNWVLSAFHRQHKRPLE
jgi:4-amino-4-deoxy-L-arabinose transferase-like glycosyltransferase